MTMLLACVSSADEAEMALAAGFDGTVGGPPSVDAAVARLEDVEGAAALVLVEPAGTRRFRLVADGVPDAAALRTIAGSFDGLLLTRRPRVVGALGPAVLGRLAKEAGSHGLAMGLGGGIEAPDVPRLIAVGIDLLLIGSALRAEDGTVDARRLAAIGALRRAAPSSRAPARDRIFLRDLVLPVAIGAYAGEHGRTQRVRFAVEASLRPAEPGQQGLAATVSYDIIADAIHRAVEGGHVELVETIAERIAAALLAVPRIAAVQVTVEKLDTGPAVVGVTIERQSPS